MWGGAWEMMLMREARTVVAVPVVPTGCSGCLGLMEVVVTPMSTIRYFDTPRT